MLKILLLNRVVVAHAFICLCGISLTHLRQQFMSIFQRDFARPWLSAAALAVALLWISYW